MESINYQNFRIDAENICVDYNGKVALYDANLRLQPGQICGLVGMNGVVVEERDVEHGIH